MGLPPCQDETVPAGRPLIFHAGSQQCQAKTWLPFDTDEPPAGLTAQPSCLHFNFTEEGAPALTKGIARVCKLKSC